MTVGVARVGRGTTVRPAARYAQRLLPAPAARLLGFAPLVTFCCLTWAGTLRPARPGPMLAAALLSVVAAAALLAAGARRQTRPPVRRGTTVAVAIVLLLALLLAAGVAPSRLDPRHWGVLAGDLGRGLGDLPSTTVPYKGRNEDVRTVLLLLGGLMAGGAAVLAATPTRRGGLRGPLPAALLLGIAFAVPAVQRQDHLPWLQGAAFALLLCIFLGLERVQRDAAPIALGVVIAAALAGLAIAPRLDASGPLIDPESLARPLAGDGKGAAFDWTQSYGPLSWPRKGTEVLRIQAKTGTYWKAQSLSLFDGLRWARPREVLSDDESGPPTPVQRQWLERIHVDVRGMTTPVFVGAGTTLSITDSPRTPVPSAPGTYRTSTKPLHKGNSYDALVLTPRPTRRQLARADGAPPSWTWPYVQMDLPEALGGPGPQRSGDRGMFPATPVGHQIVFPVYGASGAPFVQAAYPGADTQPATPFLLRSPYAGVYRLAARLKQGTTRPAEYAQAIQRYLGKGFTYTERPAAAKVPLASFLLDTKAGYCQQFAGAMALLLRMGGVPARVAAGFTTGTYDRDNKQFVVRDTDAHAWVEAYLAPFGWVSFDPTPPSAPARISSTSSLAALGYGGGVSERLTGALDRTGDAAPIDDGATDGGPALALLVAGGVLLLAVLAGPAALLARRRRDHRPPVERALAELRSALARTGRISRPDTTLQGMLVRFGGTPAEPYLRSLQAARYGHGSAPTPAMRAALRKELTLGVGPWATLGAWRALPPSPSLRRSRRHRGSYPGPR